jgi:hypothetical protein
MAAIKGGDKLKARLEQIARTIGNASSVKIGFLENSTYPDGTSTPMVAAVQEFGAPSKGIPPRPFMRNMIAAKSGEWPAAVAELIVDTDYDALRTLQLTGEAISGQLQQSIIDTNSPPLAESTLRARGVATSTKFNPADMGTFGAKPLVDTGHMLDSVTYQVKE